MPRPRTPQDLMVANGWWMEMPNLVSPHFETFSGLGLTTEDVSIVDGGSNLTYKFSNQLKNVPEVTLTRTMDNSSDDLALEALVNACMNEGFKFPATLVKTHNGREVFRLAFVGFKFTTYNFPDFDVNSGEKFTQNFTASIDSWFKI